MWSSIAVRTAAAVRIHCLKLQPQCSVLSHRLIRSARPPVAQPFEEGHDATEPPVREVGTDQTLDLIPQLSGRERRLAAILIAYSFTPDHVRRIIEHFRYKSSLYEFEPETLRESIQFWLNNVHPDKVRTV